MRNIAHIADSFLPKSENKYLLIKEFYTTNDIIEQILKAHNEGILETKKLAVHIPGKSITEFTRNLYNLLKKNVKYRTDPEYIQMVKNPAKTWNDKIADCKSYSVFLGTTLENAGIPFKYRFVSFSGSTRPTHVYVIVPFKNKYITLDVVMPEYDKEKPFTFKKDIEMNQGLYRVTGIGNTKRNINPKPIPLKVDFKGKNPADMTEGEMDLYIALDRAKTNKSISENLSGIGNLTSEKYQDTIDMLEDSIEAVNDYMNGLTDDPEEDLNDIAEDAINGLYSMAHEVYGIGGIAGKKKRKARKAKRKAKRKTRKAKRKERKAQKKAIKKQFKGKQKRIKLRAWRRAHGTKTGKFLQKAGRAVKKGAKAVTRVVTAPARLVAKGVLEIQLPKSAPFFLYLFINDKKTIAKLPVKVREKRKKAEKVANFIIQGIGMKRKHFMGIVRNGIMKRYGKSPEKVIEEQMRGKMNGIGAVGAVLGAVVFIIQKIAGLFKGKKKKIKVTKNDLPEAEDWGEITKPKVFKAKSQAEVKDALLKLQNRVKKNHRLKNKVQKLQIKAAKNPNKARSLAKITEKLNILNSARQSLTTGKTGDKVNKVLDTLNLFIDKQPEDKEQTVSITQLAKEIKTQPENVSPGADQSEFNEFDSGGRSFWDSLNF